VTRQFAVFVLVGGIAALANIASRFAFSHFLPLEAAVVLAYLAGMAVAFALMRAHVFRPASGSLRRQVTMFAAVNAVALAQTLAVTLLLAQWLLPALGVRNHADDIAHIVGVCVPIVTSYFGHKHVSFR
jgi:putative flippase GtrA